MEMKMVDGVLVPLSHEEKLARKEETLAVPMALWLTKMEDSDGGLPRWAEDLFDLVTGAKTVEDLPELAQRIAGKKVLRATKPQP